MLRISDQRHVQSKEHSRLTARDLALIKRHGLRSSGRREFDCVHYFASICASCCVVGLLLSVKPWSYPADVVIDIRLREPKRSLRPNSND